MASTHPWGETKEGVDMKGFVQDIRVSSAPIACSVPCITFDKYIR
jgi:hypothetical protein